MARKDTGMTSSLSPQGKSGTDNKKIGGFSIMDFHR